MIRYDWRGPRPCAVCGYARKGRHLPVELCGLRPCPDPPKHHKFVPQPDPFHAEPRRTIVTEMAIAWRDREKHGRLALNALESSIGTDEKDDWFVQTRQELDQKAAAERRLVSILNIWHAAREEQE